MSQGHTGHTFDLGISETLKGYPCKNNLATERLGDIKAPKHG